MLRRSSSMLQLISSLLTLLVPPTNYRWAAFGAQVRTTKTTTTGVGTGILGLRELEEIELCGTAEVDAFKICIETNDCSTCESTEDGGGGGDDLVGAFLQNIEELEQYETLGGDDLKNELLNDCNLYGEVQCHVDTCCSSCTNQLELLIGCQILVSAMIVTTSGHGDDVLSPITECELPCSSSSTEDTDSSSATQDSSITTNATSLPPAAGDGSSLVDDTSCTDIPDWTDDHGDDCEYYEAAIACDYADTFGGPNGVTATEACCVCGGGSLPDATTQPSVVAVTPSPTVGGTPPASDASECTDMPGWTDSYGDSCEWYQDRIDECDDAIHYPDVNGITAIEACCICGGGSLQEATQPSVVVTPPPTVGDTPVPYATDPPPCTDIVGWTDSDGDGCGWYQESVNSCDNAYLYEYGGLSATGACCVCGGGRHGTQAPTISPSPSEQPTQTPSDYPSLLPPSSTTDHPSAQPSQAPSTEGVGIPVSFEIFNTLQLQAKDLSEQHLMLLQKAFTDFVWHMDSRMYGAKLLAVRDAKCRQTDKISKSLPDGEPLACQIVNAHYKVHLAVHLAGDRTGTEAIYQQTVTKIKAGFLQKSLKEAVLKEESLKWFEFPFRVSGPVSEEVTNNPPSPPSSPPDYKLLLGIVFLGVGFPLLVMGILGFVYCRKKKIRTEREENKTAGAADDLHSIKPHPEANCSSQDPEEVTQNVDVSMSCTDHVEGPTLIDSTGGFASDSICQLVNPEDSITHHEHDEPNQETPVASLTVKRVKLLGLHSHQGRLLMHKRGFLFAAKGFRVKLPWSDLNRPLGVTSEEEEGATPYLEISKRDKSKIWKFQMEGKQMSKVADWVLEHLDDEEFWDQDP